MTRIQHPNPKQAATSRLFFCSQKISDEQGVPQTFLGMGSYPPLTADLSMSHRHSNFQSDSVQLRRYYFNELGIKSIDMSPDRKYLVMATFKHETREEAGSRIEQNYGFAPGKNMGPSYKYSL